jgi:serine/threonine protein kinase
MMQDYAITPKVLGEGNYGQVRKCIHCKTFCAYACKLMYKSKIGRLDHLRHEVNLLSALDHQNIIKMVGCYKDTKLVHIVTKKYNGRELIKKIVENTTSDWCLTKCAVSSIIKTLLRVVNYLHENNIVHWDIKPENILFELEQGDALIRLIEFGLSKRHMEGKVPMSNCIGTAYYMSPELLKGKYNRYTHIWSIRIVTYILLCGYPPFWGRY